MVYNENSIQYLLIADPETTAEKKTVSCLLSALDENTLERVMSNAASGYVRFVAKKFLERRPKKNPEIQDVLKWYSDRRSKMTGYAFEQIRRRYDGQDDKMKQQIACAVMRVGTIKDREWISDKLSAQWYDECSTALVDAWKSCGFNGPLTVLAYKHAPLAFLRENLDDIVAANGEKGKMDYRLKARLCETDSETLEPSEWNLMEYLYICSSSGKDIDAFAVEARIACWLQNAIEVRENAGHTFFSEDRFNITELSGVRQMIFYLSSMGRIDILEHIIDLDKTASENAYKDLDNSNSDDDIAFAAAYCRALKGLLA